MGRIKYQEALGLEVKQGRPPAGPGQLVLDEGQDLIEFFHRTRGAMKNRSITTRPLKRGADSKKIQRKKKAMGC